MLTIGLENFFLKKGRTFTVVSRLVNPFFGRHHPAWMNKLNRLSLCVCQVWGMVLLDQESRLLTGSADSELRAWDISYLQEVRRNAARPAF